MKEKMTGKKRRKKNVTSQSPGARASELSSYAHENTEKERFERGGIVRRKSQCKIVNSESNKQTWNDNKQNTTTYS